MDMNIIFDRGRLRHRHCRWPDSYLTPSELDAKYGKGTWVRMHPAGATRRQGLRVVVRSR